MKKCVLLGSLLSFGIIDWAWASQEKTLMHALLTGEKHIFDDLPPEMQCDLGSWIMCDNPVVHFILKELSKEHLSLQDHTLEIRSAEFNQMGTRVVTASADTTAKIWDVATGKCLQTLVGHKGPLWFAQFNGSGDKVVTTSGDKKAKIWDVLTGTCLHTLEGHTERVWPAAFSSSGDKVVTASDDATAKIWDVASGMCLQTLQGHTDFIWSVTFNNSGDRVVTGSKDGSAKIWDVMNGACLHTLTGHMQILNGYGDTGEVYSAAFSHSGDKIVTASKDRSAKIWDVMNGTCLHTLTGHTGEVYTVAFTRGDKIVTGSEDCSAKIWDAQSGTCLLTLHGHTDKIVSVQFSQSGDRVLTGSHDCSAKIWDVAKGTCLYTLMGQNEKLRSAKWTENKVVAASYKTSYSKIFDLGKLSVRGRSLMTELTHRQAFLLRALYETVICRALVHQKKATVFVRGIGIHPRDTVRLTFSTYPGLQDIFNTLPWDIQETLRKYLTEIPLDSEYEPSVRKTKPIESLFDSERTPDSNKVVESKE